ncbi:hypothetical protein [Brevibacterium album]|uniref:hypothetical protein n=1 Tax=Brevibacterium album TaxID=417948 RepID=UPI000419FFDE|nr:hypothetical protein [Brevibacterium album]
MSAFRPEVVGGGADSDPPAAGSAQAGAFDLSESSEHQARLIALAAAYFGIPPAEVEAPEVSWFADDSGAVGSYGCPADRFAHLLWGRASLIRVAIFRPTRFVPRDFESVLEEYDHPAVRVVPVPAAGWNVGYSLLSGAGAGAAAVTTPTCRFIHVDTAATLSVSFEAAAGPLDHRIAVETANGVRAALEWERRHGRSVRCAGPSAS